jgi:hypothetical protein
LPQSTQRPQRINNFRHGLTRIYTVFGEVSAWVAYSNKPFFEASFGKGLILVRRAVNCPRRQPAVQPKRLSKAEQRKLDADFADIIKKTSYYDTKKSATQDIRPRRFALPRPTKWDSTMFRKAGLRKTRRGGLPPIVLLRKTRHGGSALRSDASLRGTCFGGVGGWSNEQSVLGLGNDSVSGGAAEGNREYAVLKIELTKFRILRIL